MIAHEVKNPCVELKETAVPVTSLKHYIDHSIRLYGVSVNQEHPGTPLGHPIIPRDTLETARNIPRTPKIVVSGQTAHEMTKPKTSEDSQLFIIFIRLLRITLRFPSISRMLRNIFEALKNSETTII